MLFILKGIVIIVVYIVLFVAIKKTVRERKKLRTCLLIAATVVTVAFLVSDITRAIPYFSYLASVR